MQSHGTGKTRKNLFFSIYNEEKYVSFLFMIRDSLIGVYLKLKHSKQFGDYFQVLQVGILMVWRDFLLRLE